MNGELDSVKAAFGWFIEKTANEKENPFYGISISGDEIFCREAYENAKGLLAHLENVKEPLTEMLKVADLTRLEVQAPQRSLQNWKVPMAHLNPARLSR
jgi:hypothetical protein